METLAALLTPTVAAVAGLIAYLQWRTAHMKVVLELFDRRSAVFNDAIDAVHTFLTREGNLSPFIGARDMGLAINKAQFLFGPDAIEILAREFDLLREGARLATIVERSGRSPAEQKTAAEKLLKVEAELETVRDRLTKAFVPYMRIDQKRVRTPREWFHERNELRKSYGEPSA